MLKYLFFLILSGFMCLLGFLVYSGLFHPIEIEETTSPNYTLVYKRVQGEYRQVGRIAGEVSAFLKDKFIEGSGSFGLFFDNPQKIEGAKLKSIAGVILGEEEYNRIDEVKKTYQVAEYMKQTVLKVEFPYRNKTSIVLGILQVYPAIKKYIKSHPKFQFNPVLEIYNYEEGSIVYYMSIFTKEDMLPDYWREN